MSTGNFTFPSTGGGDGGGGGDPVEAGDVTYTATTTGDWPGADPVDVEEALDTLAERVTDVEAVSLMRYATSTGAIDESDATDINVPLPAGCSAASIQSILVTKTAGDSTSAAVTAWKTDARDSEWADGNAHIFGDSFGTTVNPGPVQGPLIKLPGASPIPLLIPYININGSAFIRLSFLNTSFADSGTWDFVIHYIPIV